MLLHAYRHPQHELAIRDALAARAARTCTSRSRTRSSARSASTSAPRRRRSTPPSPPCSAATCAGSPTRAREAGLPEPAIMQSQRRPDRPRERRRARRLDGALGPGRRRRRRRVRGARRRRRARAVPRHGRHLVPTSASSHDGAVAETGASEIAGRPIALPTLDVHTVGAGGGSIAWRDAGGALRVGPRSAGAVPGPACYGRGGERADRHRREPAARPPARRRAARRRRDARPRRRRARGRRARRASSGSTGRPARRGSCASRTPR